MELNWLGRLEWRKDRNGGTGGSIPKSRIQFLWENRLALTDFRGGGGKLLGFLFGVGGEIPEGRLRGGWIG